MKEELKGVDLTAGTMTAGWGPTFEGVQSWLRSDMKDMSYRYVYPLYKTIQEKIR